VGYGYRVGQVGPPHLGDPPLSAVQHLEEEALLLLQLILLLLFPLKNRSCSILKGESQFLLLKIEPAPNEKLREIK